MEKNKTTLSQIRETVNKQIEYYKENNADLIVIKELEDIDKLLRGHLEAEKQQILEAFHSGDNSDCTSEQNAYEFAEQYYKDTYEE